MNPTPGAAGPKEDTARTKVSAATAAYNLGYYEDAAHQYEEAYRLILDPALLYNIGQAYRLAGKPDRAITAYRSFLRTKSVDPPRQQQVKKRIQELEMLIAENKRSTSPVANSESSPSTIPNRSTESPSDIPAPPTARAENSSWPMTNFSQLSHHQHDALFIRLSFGGGYLSAWKSPPGSTIAVYGPAFVFTAAFGWAWTHSLVLYGEVVLMEASNPSVSSAGSSSGTTMSMIGLGPGFAYYLQPKNYYFSGTIIFPKISISSTNPAANLGDTDHGIGLSAAFGKEWWVSSNWGIGAALQLHAASMKDRGIDTRTTGFDLALLFSATYN